MNSRKSKAFDFPKMELEARDFPKMEPHQHDFPIMEARDFPKIELEARDFQMNYRKSKAFDFPKTELEARDFPKMEPHEQDFSIMEARDFGTEARDFPKTEVPVFVKTEFHNFFPEKEEPGGASSTLTSTTESMSLKSNQNTRDFMSLLLSYPVRITDDNNSNWYNLIEGPRLLSDKKPLRYVEGLVPKEIIRDIEKGERSIFNDDEIPAAILNLSADLAVDQLIQTLFSKHHHHHDHAPNIKYIRLSTRSGIEKRAVMEKIQVALKDKHSMLEFRKAFHGTLRIDTSTYQIPVENQVRQHVDQLLQLPMITENATQDDQILWTSRYIEEEMVSNRYLVLLVDRDVEEKLDPWKVGFSETNLSGVVVLITTEPSTQYEDELITEMDVEIRTRDHLLPWEVFCHSVGGKVVCSSSAIQTIAVSIVEECRGHLLATVLVAKWLKNLQDVKLWELALHRMRYTNPSYDIVNFHGLSRVMINTFVNFIWDVINKTQKHCLVRCLFIPNIRDGKVDYELMNDWISSLLVDAEEAEHNLRELVDHSVLLQFEGSGGRYIRLPEETYEILQSLSTLNPLFIKKSGLGLAELPDTELWHSAVQIELADNKLSELPLSPNWLELTVLMLQGNADLTKIPPLFFVHMPLLRILNLSYTSVRELPSSFFNLEQLRELYLKGCECFMKLPPEIGKLQKLEKLDLDETQIIHMPKEIQELTNMQSLILYFYEYRGKKNKPYSCSTIIPSGVISKLKGLKHLRIDVNPDDERWHENVKIILPEILGLECLQTLNIYVPQLELLKLIPGRILEVDFRFVVGCHMQRIISSIPPTVDVKFKQSDCSLKFVKGADVPSEIKLLLRHSKALFLDRHMTIKNLSEFEMMNLEQLRVCILAECKEMQTIVDGRHSNSNNDILSHLQFLSVSHMKNLRSFWEGPTPPRCFFGMLQSLSLQSCPKLTTLFSLDFVGNLSPLKELIVKDCPKLSTLISHEPSKHKVDIFLRKLRKLSLLHLPELISISNGLHIGPHLKEIGFYDCPKLLSLSRNELSSQELMVIKGETNWWKALKWSKGEWGNAGRPSKFNLIFSTVNVEADVMTQLGVYNDDDIDDGPGGSLGESLQPTEVATPMFIKPTALTDRSPRAQKQNVYKQSKYFPTWTKEGPYLLDDGYAWRKYGQKHIPHTKYPRDYFRCVHKYDQGCLARKEVERFNDEDPPSYKTIHKGMHTCKPNQSSIVASIDDSVTESTIHKGKHTSPQASSEDSMVPGERKHACTLVSNNDSVVTRASNEEINVDVWQGTTGLVACASSSGASISSNRRAFAPECSQSCYSDQHRSSDMTYGSPISWSSSDDDDNELKHKLRELEISLSRTESDSVDHTSPISYCCLKDGLHQASPMAKWNSDLIAELIPKIDLREVLIVCAQAVSNDDISAAIGWMDNVLAMMVSVSGEPIQRLGAYLLEGLRARLESSGSLVYKALKCESYIHILYQICPYWKFAYLSANVVIAEAMENESRIHIIDFRIVKGSQWMSLMKALEHRPGGPPFIRVTGIDDSQLSHARGGGLQVVGERLSNYAKSCGVPFEFHSAVMSDWEVERENLGIRPGEALAVNFPYVLRSMPDESVSTVNHRDRLLRLVKSLSPKVVTLVEQESNTNSGPFFQRFVETLNYYTAMFESIDVALPRDDKQRISAEQHCVARDIVNVIACEGAERVERHELLGKWRLRLSMAGFTQCPLSSSLTDLARDLLKGFSENYKLEQRDGALYLGWRKRALATSSAWR